MFLKVDFNKKKKISSYPVTFSVAPSENKIIPCSRVWIALVLCLSVRLVPRIVLVRFVFPSIVFFLVILATYFRRASTCIA